ncbi:MAG: hypothetical protein IAE63_00665 [Alphaproteobacteria bacterium]|nr:hypothetical protein [Alphaproteobacteria bacterium]
MISSPSSNYGNGNIYTTIQRLDSSNAEFGLSNTNSAKERISSIQNVDLASEPSVYSIIQQQEASDSAFEFGLNDKNPVAERLGYVKQMHQRIVQNHGFEAKKATIAALSRNTMIVNIPPDQRGTIADLSA